MSRHIGHICCSFFQLRVEIISHNYTSHFDRYILYLCPSSISLCHPLFLQLSCLTSLTLSFCLSLVSPLSPLPMSSPGSRVHDPAGFNRAVTAAVAALTAARPGPQAGVLERVRSGQRYPCAHIPPGLSPENRPWGTLPGMSI